MSLQWIIKYITHHSHGTRLGEPWTKKPLNFSDLMFKITSTLDQIQISASVPKYFTHLYDKYLREKNKIQRNNVLGSCNL